MNNQVLFDQLLNHLKREFLEPLQNDMKALKKSIDRLNHKVRTFFLVTDEQQRKRMLVSLSEQQRSIFSEIARLDGDDNRARKKIQKLLHNLEGSKITSVLARALKILLKVRKWSIKCPTCQQPAAPLWQADSAYEAGGRMQFTHTGPAGRSVSHGSCTVMPKVTLIPRPPKKPAH